MDNSYGLLKIQETNLKILKEIDRICSAYKIKYMLDAGTLLGAVRHGGFIPWDDDADIAMTRNSWEAFKKVAGRELPEGMKLILPTDYHGGKAFYDFTPRIIYEASRRHKRDSESEYYDEVTNHLWVDIFILDDLPSHAIGAWLAKFRQKQIYLLSMGHRYKLDYDKYSPIHKLMVGTVSQIGKAIPMKHLCKVQNSAAKRFKSKSSKYVYYSNYQPDFMYVTLEKKWATDIVRMGFEDTQLCVPRYYDAVLTWVYGDYMKLPAKEDRKPSHGSREIEIYG